MHFNVTSNSASAISDVDRLTTSIRALTKQAASLQAININSLARGVVAPKFQWNEGLRQTDALVKNIQKAKLSATEFFNVYRNRTNELVQQQMRLQNAYATPLGGGATAVTIPSSAEMGKFANATQLANTRLAVQSEVLRGLGTKVQDWGKNTQWAGRQMMVGITVPFAMAAAAAGMYANKIDAAMVRVEKVVNGSLDGFRAKAMKTATDITKSVGQSVESSLQVMAELAAAGKEGNELMQETKQAQTLAVLGDMDQQSAIKGMISMQSIYKLSTNQLADAINYLNAVEDQTPTKLQDLVDAIPIAGTIVAQLGGTLQDTTVLLTAFRDRGIQTVEGANAIKTAMNRILAPTKAASGMFKELTGKSLEGLVKATGGKPLETFQALSDAIMGGNLALEDQQKLISETVGIYQSSRITALLAGLHEQTGSVAIAKGISEESPEAWAARTARSLKTITESASGRWRIAIETFKTQLQPVGDIALKVGTAIVKGFSKALEIFNAIPEPVRMIVLGVTALVAVAGPISMIVGIFANFMGTVIKTGAFLMGMRSKYKLMTIDQKAAALTTGELDSKMMTQAETTQVLIYQLDKLRAAYLETTAAAKTTALAAQMPSSGQWNVANMTKQAGLSMPLAGLAIPQKGEASNISRWDVSGLLAKNADGLNTIGEAEKKNSMLAKAFNSQTLLGVGIAAQLGSSVAETGSGLEKWLNYISLASIGIGAIAPVLTKIGSAVKGSAIVGAIGGLSTKLGETAKGFGSKILSGGKAALTGLSSFVMGPWGLAIGATLVGIWGLHKLLNAKTEEQRRHQDAITHSTDTWAQLLGKSKLEWGQIRTESGKVKDNMASIVDKMREKLPDLIQEIQNTTGAARQNLIENEVMKLQGQGFNKDEIMKQMDALLQAASLKRADIDKILGHIAVKFDFSGGQKDLKAFLENSKEMVTKNLNIYSKSISTRGGKDIVLDENGNPIERSKLQDTDAEKYASYVYDRLTSMDDATRGIYARQEASNISAMFNDSFKQLDKEGKIAKSWTEARKKFFQWDASEGKMVRNEDLDRAVASGQITEDQAHSMEMLIDTEQRYAQAIAKKLKLSDKDVHNIKQMNDLLPFVTKENLSAKEAQKSYNDVVDKAKKSGKEMTDAEKAKLAQLYATTYGLNATALATNSYSDSMYKAQGSTQAANRALAEYINQLKVGYPDAVEEFWGSGASGNQGFMDALGGDPQTQAKALTENVKGIYSGTMNDIYSAFAAQADEQWQARLNSIANSYEAKRKSVQAQLEAADKAYEGKQDAFQSRWDDRMESNKKSYEERQKAIEADAKTQLDAIEAQIKAEQDKEEARQRQFDAEKKRIERLTELANRSIDYNRALATGNLDEAARVMNNTESMTVGWGTEDAKDRSSLLSEKQTAELGATKELIESKKQAKLDALKEEQDATEKALDAQRKAEQKSMEMSRDIERERLQNKLDSLGQEQTAAETTERRKQEMNKRTLDIELATLKTFIPQNEQQLAEHVARISSAYGNYGVNLQTAGGYWGQIIGNALSNNVDRARQEMSNGAAWAAFGASVAGSISQGAFGLSLSDFFTLIATGQPPQGWTPPGVNMEGKTMLGSSGRRQFYHTGGEVGKDAGGRPGLAYNSPINGDEVEAVLKRGEFVFPKSAVQLYGSDNLRRMASGTPPVQQDTGTGVGLVFGSMMGALGHSIIGLAMNNLMATAMQSFGGGAVGGTGSAVDFAKAQDGKPYIWASSGPSGYDCSGYQSAIANVLTGQENPYKRIFSTGMVKAGVPFGPFVPGLGGPFQIGVKHGNPGHTAGTLMGVGVESTGDHVRYGKDAHLATDKQFNMFFHIPEDKIAAGSAIPGLGAVTGEPGSDKAQQRVKAVAAGYGWAGGDQWTALYNLIQKESSWNPNAANPSSSARGLFQKMTSIHGPLEPTIEGQAKWGLDYIRGRYGSPSAAWAFHQRKGFYDAGGDIHPGMTGVMNGTGQIETVVTHNTRKEITTSLDKAAMTYKSLDLAMRSFSPINIADQVAPSSGDVYNDIKVEINGSGLSQRELELAVANGISNATASKDKRLGRRK